MTTKVDEEWFSITPLQTKRQCCEDCHVRQTELEEQIISLEQKAEQFTEQIISLQKIVQQCTQYINDLQKNTQTYVLKSDHTEALMEELKVLKERELNRMLREKKPIPFSSPFPLFLAKQMVPLSSPLHRHMSLNTKL